MIFLRNIFLTLFFYGFLFSIEAVPVNDRTTERYLHENHYFLDFMNVALSNFGNDDLNKKLIQAAQFDFKAKVWQLQGNYKECYKQIRNSQQILKDLYYNVLLSVYIEEAKKILQTVSPLIVNSNNPLSKKYISYAYQHIALAEKAASLGHGADEPLYSLKIKQFIEGIKNIRKSKKFTLAAMVENAKPPEEKPDYYVQTYEEAKKIDILPKTPPYKEIKDSLLDLSTRGFIKKEIIEKYNLFLHHDDNYQLIFTSKKSLVVETLNDGTINNDPLSTTNTTPVEQNNTDIKTETSEKK